MEGAAEGVVGAREEVKVKLVFEASVRQPIASQRHSL